MGSGGREATNYFESLIKITDILSRKVHICINHNDVHNIPTFRGLMDAQEPVGDCPAHPGCMVFKYQSLKSLFIKEKRERRLRTGNRLGEVNMEREEKVVEV